ncbi:hypothetical protein CRYUN_Cryun37aG0063600 [Craigia yunnanensis]
MSISSLSGSIPTGTLLQINILEGSLSSVESLKGVEHVNLLSQSSVYRASSGIQALMTNNPRKLAEKDESVLMASGIPYTIIRAGMLQNSRGGTQGFSFEEVFV